MGMPVEISPEWIQQHANIAAWLVGSCVATVLSVGSYFAQKTLRTINRIEKVQTIQAENHLKTIQDASLSTRDETIKTNAKLDVLIGVIERKF